MTEPAEEAPRFEDLLEALEALVARLERGELPLEQALEAFERGMEMARQAGRILEDAEQRVDRLLELRDGSAREVPFEPGRGE